MLQRESILKYFTERESNSKKELPDFLPAMLVESHHEHLPVVPEQSEWIIKDDPNRLVRKLSFTDVSTRNLFVNELLEYEAATNHHANMHISGLDIIIEVWTHDINQVTELDIEYASHCDDVHKDVEFIEGYYGI